MNKKLIIMTILAFLPITAYTENDQAINRKVKEIKLPPFHHVVDVKPSKEISVPEELKLSSDKKLECATCHGLKDIEDTLIDEVDTKAKDFLRGGPYKKMTDFCYRCHDEKQYERANIHKMLDENGDIIKKKCTFCHKKVLRRNRKHEPDQLKLRVALSKVCFGCHLKTPHFNSAEHQVEADEDYRKRIEEAEKKYNVRFLLDQDNHIICVTCHTPHQQGVIDEQLPAGQQVEESNLDDGITYKKHPWSDVFADDKKDRLKKNKLIKDLKLSLSYQRIDKEVLLRLPAKDGTLCLSCHEFEN